MNFEQGAWCEPVDAGLVGVSRPAMENQQLNNTIARPALFQVITRNYAE
jgi:hypothetical protein